MTAQIDKKIFYTDRGIESKSEIIQRSDYPRIQLKIKRWTEQLIDAFPHGRTMIESMLGILNYIKDIFVCQTLSYAPARIRFKLTTDPAANPVQYVYYKPAILFRQSYLEDLLKTGLESDEVYSFLANVIGELNRSAQDACGVAITRIPQLNFKDALFFHLLSEIDCEMVKTRFLREAIVPFDDGLPEIYQNSVLCYYLACEKYAATQKLCQPEQRDFITNALLALDMMEFGSENYNFDEWRLFYLNQTTACLFNRPIGSLTTTPTIPSVCTGLESYYKERFLILKELRQNIQDIDMQLLTKYVQFGEKLIKDGENVQGVSYSQLYTAYHALCQKRKSDLRKENKNRQPGEKKYRFLILRDFLPLTLLKQVRGQPYRDFRPQNRI